MSGTASFIPLCEPRGCVGGTDAPVRSGLVVVTSSSDIIETAKTERDKGLALRTPTSTVILVAWPRCGVSHARPERWTEREAPAGVLLHSSSPFFNTSPGCPAKGAILGLDDNE